LGGERPRHDLSERERQLVGILGDPAPLLYEISVHETDQRRRAAKTDCPELQKIVNERP
jgi:hypothetical protein